MRTARYGRRIRNLADAADRSRRQKYECPRCGKTKVKRKSFSIWVCRSCGAEFAGGAYSLTTAPGEMAMRLIREMKQI